MSKRKCELVVKRIMDVIFAFIGLLLVTPLLLCIAAIIKLASKGPIFFCQNRLGKDAVIFKLYKFRTMIPNAINIGSGLSTGEKDPRITPIGGFLRKTSLDELPQLFNVIKGDISLVGPRPTVPQHLKYYGEFERKRLQMWPGITGLAMVRGRNKNPWSVRIKYDVEYIENFSLWLDLKTLIQTFWVVLTGKNTYYDYENNGRAFDLSMSGKDENNGDFVSIPGENVILRQTEERDLPLKVKWFNDPEINKTLVLQEELELSKTISWFTKAKSDQTRIDFTIEDISGKPIGVAGFREIDKSEFSACIYIVIGEKEYWGKGIMYEAELLLVDYGFKHLGLSRIWGNVLEYNVASYITMKKIGFHRDEVLHQKYVKDNNFIDIYRLSILKNEFYTKNP